MLSLKLMDICGLSDRSVGIPCSGLQDVCQIQSGDQNMQPSQKNKGKYSKQEKVCVC